MRERLMQEGFDVSNCSDDYVCKLYNLLSDICYIVNEKDNSWYLATMSMPKLFELRRSLRIDGSDISISIQDVNNAIRDKKFCLVKLTQFDETRFRGFFAVADKPKKRPSLVNCRVITLQDIKTTFDKVLNCFRNGSVEINGEQYISYVKGTPTSGELLLMDKNSEMVAVPLYSIKTVSNCRLSGNAGKLVRGVYEYKGIKVTLNRDILEKYYGEQLLYSKLESKGVRYRYCYFDILIHGDMQSAYYYKSKYGIEENFSNISELLRIVKKGMTSVSEKCIARRLCSASSLLRKDGGKPSFYVTIPENAVLKEVSSNLELYKIYAVNSNGGYVSCVCYGVDIKSAKTNAMSTITHDYGGTTEIVTVVKDGNVLEGLQFLSNMQNNVLKSIAQLLKYSYTDYFRDYSERIKLVAKNNGINGISDEHIKFLFVNNLAKKYRQPNKLEYHVVIKYLLRFFDLLYKGEADDKLKKVLRRVCLENLKKVFKNLKVEDVPESGYRCKYGIIYAKDGKLSKMVDLYYDDFFVGKSVISGV